MASNDTADIFFSLIPWSNKTLDTALNMSISYGLKISNSTIPTAHFITEFFTSKMPEPNKTVTFGVLLQNNH
jgi:hypothetical protein